MSNQTSFEDIIKSPNDKKLYRLYKHESGMTVLLVSDPDINVAKQSKDESGVCAKTKVYGILTSSIVL